MFRASVFAQSFSSKLNLVDRKHIAVSVSKEIQIGGLNSFGESCFEFLGLSKLSPSNAISFTPLSPIIVEKLIQLKLTINWLLNWPSSFHHFHYNMLYANPVGLIVVFIHGGGGFYDYRSEYAFRLAGTGDFIILKYAPFGILKWSQRFKLADLYNSYKMLSYQFLNKSKSTPVCVN